MRYASRRIQKKPPRDKKTTLYTTTHTRRVLSSIRAGILLSRHTKRPPINNVLTERRIDKTRGGWIWIFIYFFYCFLFFCHCHFFREEEGNRSGRKKIEVVFIGIGPLERLFFILGFLSLFSFIPSFDPGWIRTISTHRQNSHRTRIFFILYFYFYVWADIFKASFF